MYSGPKGKMYELRIQMFFPKNIANATSDKNNEFQM